MIILVIIVLFTLFCLFSCVSKRPNYGIKLFSPPWSPSDNRKEKALPNTWIRNSIATPHQYLLTSREYTIVFEINSKGHSWPINAQIIVGSNFENKILNVKSHWQGSCGKVEKLSKNGRWDNRKDRLDSWGYGFFDNPKAIGFLWYPGTGYCQIGVPEMPEYASKFPIELEIYDGQKLIGTEKIDFEIFNNGIVYYVVMP